MKSISWKDIAELIGIGAIIASLVFVGYQIEHDRRLTQAALGSESSILIMEAFESLYDPEFSTTYAKMLENPGDLSVAEMLQINSRLESVTELFLRECYLVTRGVFNECEAIARANLPLFFGNEYAQAWWKGAKLRPLLPSWMDDEIKALDSRTEIQRIESIRGEF